MTKQKPVDNLDRMSKKNKRPLPSKWVGLTDKEVLEFTRASWGVGVTASEFIRDIEAKLKEKNNV